MAILTKYKRLIQPIAILGLFVTSCQHLSPDKITPLAVHPDNSNYFTYKGEPIMLISSTEHYSALVNRKFDYNIYLNALHNRGFNMAVVMSGIFLEPSGDSQWEDLLLPWQRSNEPGFRYGGNKFDISTWDENYFDRLEDFVAKANEKDIFVKYIFFTPFFYDRKWLASPLHPENNINKEFAGIQANDVYNLDEHRGLLDLQKGLIDRVTDRLKKYPNIIYEIVFDGGREWNDYAWYRHMWDYLHEQMGEVKKPVSFNVGVIKNPVEDLFDNASLITYRFTADETMPITHIYGKELPILMGENTFDRGWEPFVRRHAYRAVLSGHGAYTHVDFTYNSRYPDGNNAPFPRPLWGGGTDIQMSLESLVKTINSCNFIKMRPNSSLVKSTDNLFEAAVLENPGEEYLAYLSKKSDLLDYKLIYQGYIKPHEKGPYDITANVVGTYKFYLENRLVASNDQYGNHFHTGKANYNGKDPIPFKLEAFMKTLSDEARLFLGDDLDHEEAITNNRMLTTDGKTPGVEASYYTGDNFNTRTVWRIEEKAHHKTTNPSPFVEENQRRKTSFGFNLPAGKYHCQWIDTRTAAVIREFPLDHPGEETIFRTPHFIFDVLLKINRVN